jgi:hypothetical protein
MTRANTLPPGDRADDEYHEAAQALRSVGDQWHLKALNVSAAYSAIIHGRYADAAKLLDETLPLARESNDPWGCCWSGGTSGSSGFYGRGRRCTDRLEEQPRICRDHNIRWPA